MTHDEAVVVERLLRRDESTLREVIDAYGSAVLGIARRIIVDPAGAEEVAQGIVGRVVPTDLGATTDHPIITSAG